MEIFTYNDFMMITYSLTGLAVILIVIWIYLVRKESLKQKEQTIKHSKEQQKKSKKSGGAKIRVDALGNIQFVNRAENSKGRNHAELILDKKENGRILQNGTEITRNQSCKETEDMEQYVEVFVDDVLDSARAVVASEMESTDKSEENAHSLMTSCPGGESTGSIGFHPVMQHHLSSIQEEVEGDIFNSRCVEDQLDASADVGGQGLKSVKKKNLSFGSGDGDKTKEYLDRKENNCSLTNKGVVNGYDVMNKAVDHPKPDGTEKNRVIQSETISQIDDNNINLSSKCEQKFKGPTMSRRASVCANKKRSYMISGKVAFGKETSTRNLLRKHFEEDQEHVPSVRARRDSIVSTKIRSHNILHQPPPRVSHWPSVADVLKHENSQVVPKVMRRGSVLTSARRGSIMQDVRLGQTIMPMSAFTKTADRRGSLFGKQQNPVRRASVILQTPCRRGSILQQNHARRGSVLQQTSAARGPMLHSGRRGSILQQTSVRRGSILATVKAQRTQYTGGYFGMASKVKEKFCSLYSSTGQQSSVFSGLFRRHIAQEPNKRRGSILMQGSTMIRREYIASGSKMYGDSHGRRRGSILNAGHGFPPSGSFSRRGSVAGRRQSVQIPKLQSKTMTGNLSEFKQVFGAQAHQLLMEKFEEHGPLYEFSALGQKMIFLFDPKHIEALKKAEGKCPRHIDFKHLRVYRERKQYPLGVLISDGEEWRRQRRILSKPMMGAMSNVKYLPVINEVAKLAVSVISDGLSNNGVFEPSTLIGNYVIEAFGRVLYGHDLHCLTSKKHTSLHKFVKIAKSNFEDAKMLLVLPTCVMMFHPAWKRHNQRWDFLLETTIKQISTSVNMDKKKKTWCVLDQLLENGELSEEELFINLTDLLLASIDTTLTALTWCLYELSVHPECQEKIRGEVNSVLHHDLDITSEQRQQLVYLQAVIKETLRLHPVGFFTVRIIPKTMKITGFTMIPQKVNVAPSMFVMGRNPSLVSDPEKFIPERWLHNDPDLEKFYNDVPFGFGPRMCLGRRIAETEIMLFLLHLCDKFQISLFGPDDIGHTVKLLLVPSKEIKLILRPPHTGMTIVEEEEEEET